MSLTVTLRKWLEERPYMSASIAEAVTALNVPVEKIHEAAEGDYWIFTFVDDDGEPYLALEGE